MTPCWEGPLGAVRLLLLPSWFTAVACMNASTGGALPVLSTMFVWGDDCSIRVPQPSALTYPSAPESRVWHLQQNRQSPKCQYTVAMVSSIMCTTAGYKLQSNTQYAVHNMQYAICNTQYAICNTQYAICNMRYVIRNMQYNMQYLWRLHSCRQQARAFGGCSHA